MAGATEIQAQREKLLSQIRQLGESWQGAAATALRTLYERWDTQQVQLHATLTEISNAMQQAATHYEESEQRIVKTFQA